MAIPATVARNALVPALPVFEWLFFASCGKNGFSTSEKKNRRRSLEAASANLG